MSIYLIVKIFQFSNIFTHINQLFVDIIDKDGLRSVLNNNVTPLINKSDQKG